MKSIATAKINIDVKEGMEIANRLGVLEEGKISNVHHIPTNSINVSDRVTKYSTLLWKDQRSFHSGRSVSLSISPSAVRICVCCI